jgi:septal ring factor EnvC (AmiA/AmiB activator)
VRASQFAQPDGVAVAASNEGKKNQAEREQSRVAIEREQAEREKLETKLTQCETALRETKAALVEARGEAKEVRDSIGRADARMRRTTTTRAVRTIATTARGRRDARANG